MAKNSFLPSLDDMGLDFSRETVQHELEDEVSEKAAYEQFKYDQQNRTGANLDAQAPVITLEMLEKAPANFFKKFEPLAESVSKSIINALSADTRSAHISNLRKEPNNKEYREKALYSVINQFDSIDKVNNEVKLLESIDKDILLALVINEIVGLGPIEPIWNNEKVTEIICNGPYKIKLEMDGQLRYVNSARFRDKDHLMNLINKLYGSINKSISPTTPQERGRLHDNSRLFASHTTIAPAGPNFNIRKHPRRYWTPLDLVNNGTASVEVMTYVGNLINSELSYLVIGGTGTGKTSFLNAISGFYNPNRQISTAEENLELKLHPGKMQAAPLECLPARPGSSKEYEVSLKDLLRGILQSRPDIILFGEVSDGSAYYLCQALNTGHSGGATLHSDNAQDGMERAVSLVSQEEVVKGDAAFNIIATAVDVVFVLERLEDGSRKLTEIAEVGRRAVPDPNGSGNVILETTPLWEFNADVRTRPDGTEYTDYSWEQVNELSDYRKKKNRLNLKKQKTWEELLELSTYNIPEHLRGGV